ncbi:hypothetical protein AVEN_27116-1 [Araneus ventricosus]|uniref:RNase H type-1 domain-containing protein n=1 Tax=Araneus ventricosus TaxID=182803 RepID=A0A4Y2WFG3_ARAVE|nr:hypothetical protein AVEN_27116-1 [Araneus ventricosus]
MNFFTHSRVGFERVGVPFITYLLLKQTFDSLTEDPLRDPSSIGVYMRELQAQGFKILFCWVPSHAGIVGNEQADSAAKAASSIWQSPVPCHDLKIFTTRHIHFLWQESWDLEISNKLHFIKPRINIWTIIPIRVADVKLTRLRIGHTRFTHEHLLFGERAPECQTCHTNFTVAHILTECPTFNSYRVTYFNTSSPNMKELLGEFPHPHLFDFLKAVGFYHSI